MVQGFKELETDTEVSEFTNKLLICAVKSRSELLEDPPSHFLWVFIPLSIASVFGNSVLLLLFNETSMLVIFDGRLGCLQLKVMLFFPQTDSAGRLCRFLCANMTPKF